MVWIRRRIFKSNVDTPKTERSARRVALSLGTKDLLEEWANGLVSGKDSWLFPSTTLTTPVRLNNLWRRNFAPKLKPIGLEWATFQVMRRSFASLAKEAGVDAHTRSAHMGNSVDVNENEYAVSSFESRLAAVRKLESAVGRLTAAGGVSEGLLATRNLARNWESEGLKELVEFGGTEWKR